MVERGYVGANGESFRVNFIKTRSASAAYSLLRTVSAGGANARTALLEGVGVLGNAGTDGIRFIKGASYVEIKPQTGASENPNALLDFAKAFAGTLEGEAGVPPVLVAHLPDGEKSAGDAGYALSLPVLQLAAGNRPALDALTFEGGTEAVTARYGDARLVIVEFTTPQYAGDNDTRIKERIAQLQAEGKPIPSSYRRVGNYSVFVFDAPDAAAAEQLSAGVKYEKDVRWLGPNPHAEEIAVKQYTETMGGVILTTLKMTGLAILLCLGVGGIFGGAVFMYRRAQTAGKEVFSDAGGMMRLNLEEMGAPPHRSKLVGRSEE